MVMVNLWLVIIHGRLMIVSHRTIEGIAVKGLKPFAIEWYMIGQCLLYQWLAYNDHGGTSNGC